MKLTEAQQRALRIVGLRGYAGSCGSGSFVGQRMNGVHTGTAERLAKLQLVSLQGSRWGTGYSVTITPAGRQWLADHPERTTP